MWNNWVLYYTISICISCKILDLAHGAMMEFHFGPLREKVWAPPIYMMSSMCALTALLAPPCPELELIFWTQTHHRKKSAPVTRVSDDNNTGKSYLYRVRMFAFSLESQKDKVRKITVFHGLFERGFSLLPAYSHWWNDVTENGKTKTPMSSKQEFWEKLQNLKCNYRAMKEHNSRSGHTTSSGSALQKWTTFMMKGWLDAGSKMSICNVGKQWLIFTGTCALMSLPMSSSTTTRPLWSWLNRHDTSRGPADSSGWARNSGKCPANFLREGRRRDPDQRLRGADSSPSTDLKAKSWLLGGWTAEKKHGIKFVYRAPFYSMC